MDATFSTMLCPVSSFRAFFSCSLYWAKSLLLISAFNIAISCFLPMISNNFLFLTPNTSPVYGFNFLSLNVRVVLMGLGQHHFCEIPSFHFCFLRQMKFLVAVMILKYIFVVDFPFDFSAFFYP